MKKLAGSTELERARKMEARNRMVLIGIGWCSHSPLVNKLIKKKLTGNKNDLTEVAFSKQAFHAFGWIANWKIFIH